MIHTWHKIDTVEWLFHGFQHQFGKICLVETYKYVLQDLSV